MVSYGSLKVPPAVYSRMPMTRGHIEAGLSKPAIYFNVTIGKDDATPGITAAQISSHPLLVIAMKQAGVAVKKRVYEAYKVAQMSYINSPSTEFNKSGAPALKESGALEDAMKDTGGVDVIDLGNGTVRCIVSWNIPTAGSSEYGSRINTGFPYLWAQEYGANMKTILTPDGKVVPKEWRLTPRPFFISGINSANAEAAAKVAIIYSPVIQMLQNTPAIRTQRFNWKLLPSMFSTTIVGMLMYFAPPSIMYAYVGGAQDIMGAWTGSLLEERQMFGWGRQYLWGQIGMTKKTVRRKFRRGLWG